MPTLAFLCSFEFFNTFKPLLWFLWLVGQCRDCLKWWAASCFLSIKQKVFMKFSWLARIWWQPTRVSIKWEHSLNSLKTWIAKSWPGILHASFKTEDILEIKFYWNNLITYSYEYNVFRGVYAPRSKWRENAVNWLYWYFNCFIIQLLWLSLRAF